MLKRLVVVMALVLVWGTAARAQQEPADILRTLDFKEGTITLGADLATIDQSETFRFLNNADTQTFLTRIWGNPPGAGASSLGMLVPTDASPFEEDGWAVLIHYEGSGYVSDEDAADIDYDALMADMKKDVARANEQRLKDGLDSIELLGWAEPPRYDPAGKKLYWAKRLRFGGSPYETLNYEIRILGRRGVLELNVIADMSALPSIDGKVDSILSMVHFNQGNTYAEFNPEVDEAAAYGLAGLIAGGVLTKAGFFKGLIALLLASKKAVFMALVGAAAAGWSVVKRVLGGRKGPPPAA